MALTERRVLNQLTVLPQAGTIQVQWADQILRDGEFVSETYHRGAYAEEQRPLIEEAFGALLGDSVIQAEVMRQERDTTQAQLATVSAALTAMTGERDALQADLSTATADRDQKALDVQSKSNDLTATQTQLSTVTAERNSALAQLAAATAERDALLVPVVPERVSVTMTQARLALNRSGLLTIINEAIANMPGVAGEEARIEWASSSRVSRDRPLLVSLASSLGMSDEQLDDLFALAATL